MDGRISNLMPLIRGAIRWIRRLARVLWKILALSVVSFWLGVPEARDRIAEDIRDLVFNWGIPTRHGDSIYRVFRIVAVTVIIICWIVYAEVIVLFLRLIF